MKNIFFSFIGLTFLIAGPAAATPLAVVEDDLAGFPIRSFFVQLEAGHLYDISTSYGLTDLGPASADATLSLIPNGSITAVAGSVDCLTVYGTWMPGPACFKYTPPGSGTVDFTLLMRATTTESPGKVSVWTRDITMGGPWVNVESAVVFGGGVMETSETSGRMVLRTAHQPGAAKMHWILSFNWGWQLFAATGFNGPVGYAATLDIPEVAGTDYAGITYHAFGSPYISTAGATRMIHNRWYELGYDQDGDGLDFLVENALGTCDDGTQVTGTGFECKTLYGCELDPYGEDCLRSTRDTDHDGLRDDLETFGYSKSSGSDPWPELELPAMGADPAHYDVFIELDAQDQDTVLGGCQPFTDVNTIGGSNFGNLVDWAQQVFDEAPVKTTSGVTINPDGMPGIDLHWDLGLDNPDLEDTRWGNWGGGNTCLPSNCDQHQAWAEDPVCGAVPAQDPHRRFVFRWALDAPGEYGGQAGGSYYGAAATVAHVHELGHVGGLTHGAPRFGAANNHVGANFRLLYPSRINYRFGIREDADWATHWTTLAFSDGDWASLFPQGVSSAVGLPEISPIPGVDLGVLEAGDPSETVQDNPLGDNVDWDRNGVFGDIPGPRPFTGQIYFTPAGRLSRMNTPRTGQRPLHGVDAAIVNDVLIAADTGGGYARLRGDSDENCDLYPTVGWRDLGLSSGYRACFDWEPGETLLHDEGTPIHAEGISIARAVLSGQERLLVLTTSSTDGANWAVVGVQSTPTVVDMSAIDFKGTFAAGTALSLTPNDEPELVTLPSGGVVAIFRDATTGALFQAHHPPTLGGWWTTPTALLVDGSAPNYDVVPAATSINGETYAVGSFGVTSAVLRLTSVSGGQWVTVENMPASTTPDSDPRGRLELVAAPQVLNPTVTEFYVFGRASAGDDAGRATFRFKQLSALGSGIWSGTEVYWNSPWPRGGSYRVAAIWDDRNSVSPETQDLRLLQYIDTACRSDAECETDLVGGAECNEDNRCEDDVGEVIGELSFHPFARGSDPTFYGDYDDWAMMWWGFCEHTQWAEDNDWVPTGTTSYRPLPYTGLARCGPGPMFVEPTAPGAGFPLVAAPDDSERTTNPGLYAPSGHVCEL